MTDETAGEGLAPADDTLTPESEALDGNTEVTEGLEPGDLEEAPKPKKSAKERIDELTAARRTAERDAEYWREQAMLAAPAAPVPAPQPVQGKPDPSQFAEGLYDPDYIEALTDWKAEQTVSRVIQTRERASTVQQAVQSFEQRVSQTFPDGEPAGLIALRRAPSLPEAVQEIILSSENGPKLADYLGSNPGEFGRLSAMTPHKQAYELAKIEQRLVAPPKTQTTAPEPTPTARGTGGRFQVAPDTSDFAAFEKQFGG